MSLIPGKGADQATFGSRPIKRGSCLVPASLSHTPVLTRQLLQLLQQPDHGLRVQLAVLQEVSAFGVPLGRRRGVFLQHQVSQLDAGGHSIGDRQPVVGQVRDQGVSTSLML